MTNTKEIRLNPHDAQREILTTLFDDPNNETLGAVVCASRGFGKTYLSAIAVLRALVELKAAPKSVEEDKLRICIFAPTTEQAIGIYTPVFRSIGITGMAAKAHERIGRYWFHSDYLNPLLDKPNILVEVTGYSKAETTRGKGVYFAVLDEVSSWKPTADINAARAWEAFIQPAILTRWNRIHSKEHTVNPGKVLMISTPKGYDFFYDAYVREKLDTEWKSWQFTYRESPFLENKAIEKLKNFISPIDYSREYEANFEDSGSSVFYNFKRANNVFAYELKPNKDEPIHVGIDFNVNIMASVVCLVRDDNVYIIDELEGSTDTDELAKTLNSRYPNNPIIAYPDPSGKQKKSSAPTGQTDFTILEEHGIKTKAKKRTPPVVDTVNAVNAMLRNTNDVCRLFVHNQCRKTMESLERTQWIDNKSSSMKISKSEGVEHMTDGLRYFIHYKFPLKRARYVTATDNWKNS